MSHGNQNIGKPIWVNWLLLVLLLVMSGFTLTACEQSPPAGESTEQEVENQAVEEGQDRGVDPDYEAEGIDTTDDDDPE